MKPKLSGYGNIAFEFLKGVIIFMESITKREAEKILENSKPIEGFSKYYISVNGTVLSMVKPHSPRILAGTDDKVNKNHRVMMRGDDGKKYIKSVHRLVADAFIPNPCKLPDVIHIDGNKYNNHLYNLERCNLQESKINESINIDDYEWEAIDGYPYYFICKEGYIISQKTERTNILKPQIDKYGYFIFSLRNEDGIYRPVYLHRALAKVFIPNPDNLPLVVHRDGNHKNNKLNNLLWSGYHGKHFRKRRYETKYEFLKEATNVILVMKDNERWIFDTAEEASEKLNVNIIDVIKVIKGLIKSIDGYKFVEVPKPIGEYLKTSIKRNMA